MIGEENIHHKEEKEHPQRWVEIIQLRKTNNFTKLF